MDPMTLSLLIYGGSAGLKALGEGIKGSKEDDQAEQLMRLKMRGMEEDERQGAFNRGMAGRTADMTGIEMLANMRADAQDRHKKSMFKNDLWRVMG